MADVLGIHHVTAIAGDHGENFAFYAGVLGMRLVKRSVNQDDPGTYHLFYADAEGHPGSDLTFFPWGHLPAGRPGTGQITETMLAVPVNSLDFWEERLGSAGAVVGPRETRFAEALLPFRDPHGFGGALVETGDEREFTPWRDSPVPVARQVTGIHGVCIPVRGLSPTTEVLTSVLGYERLGEDAPWHRYGPRGGRSGTYVDLREAPDPPGRQGAGSVHHVAFRVADTDTQAQVRARVEAVGLRPTPVIDRFWFKSVYFLEPGGVLFELATDGPGFAVDEDPEHLGERLVLPPWLEPRRAQIEEALPPLTPRPMDA